jgi:hypothetical protein
MIECHTTGVYSSVSLRRMDPRTQRRLVLTVLVLLVLAVVVGSLL